MPDGGLVGIRDDGTFGRFTTGGFGTVMVILGESAAPTAVANDTKAKQKQATLGQLNMVLSRQTILSKAVASIEALSSRLIRRWKRSC
jgi:hypothetical protein